MKNVYVETSFISYLTSRPSSHITLLARQESARAVWDLRNDGFIPYVSKMVVDEVSKGDPKRAQHRLDICEMTTLIETTEAAEELAQRLIDSKAIPATEPEDALHIAIATTSNMDYILSFNFSHMVGAETKFVLQTAIAKMGYRPPLLVTAEDLLEVLWNKQA